MTAWIQGHLGQLALFVVLYLLLTAAWRLVKRFRRARRPRRKGDC